MHGIDIAKARAATPGCSHVIHLNNAGCSLPTRQTLEAVTGYLKREATIGGYETFDACAEDLDRPYTALAKLINCSRDEIAVVTSATEAWQQIVYGLAWQWKPGDVVITSLAEYGSNVIAFLQLAKRTGIALQVIPETAEGDVDLETLEHMLRGEYQYDSRAQSSVILPESVTTALRSSSSQLPRGTISKPVLVAINHVPTSSGKIYDAEAIGILTERYGVPYLLDACQSAGQIPLDVEKLRCDFLTATGRKYLRAPRGSGFLYCRREHLASFEPATLDNTGATWTHAHSYEIHPTAKRFERYEMSFAAKVGLGIAVEQCLEIGTTAIWHRVQTLAHVLREALSAGDVPHVRLRDRGKTLCGIVSFTVDEKPCSEIVNALRSQNINVSVSKRPSSRFDFEKRQLDEVVRASVHYYNTEEECHRLVEAIAKMI